jgi:hypothetical protein
MRGMQKLILPAILLLYPGGSSIPAQNSTDERLQPYIDVLKTQGKDPVNFVLNKLDEYDLLIFDDAWHPAVEPFEFYQQLIQSTSFQNKVKYVFVEAFSINKQNHIDAYLNSEPEDQTLLYPAFQDDFGGSGWPFKTYFDLMHTLYAVNQLLPQKQRIKVIAVNNPTYWSEIRTAEDVALFRKTLIGNDYTMYKTILAELHNFDSAKKGIFLTNTRHAYKGIKAKNGQYFWNCGTFFYQWHPGKTYSIRFHNMALFIEKEKELDVSTPPTTAGMERYNYKWVRMADGLWDSAFKAMENKPTALPLKENVFGSEAYVGNHMHKTAPNQTMYDAHDAIIFLAPLEALYNTATVDFIYTQKFKEELIRRYKILFTESQLEKQFKSYEVNNLIDLIEKICVAEAEELIPQAKSLPPMDAWKYEAK